jgi:nitroreductase
VKFNTEAKMSEIIENRRSIRKFKADKPVTKEQINCLLSAAMMAPSACNSRPWEFIAITKRETLDEIVRIHPYAGMCKTASAAIIVVAVPQTKEGPQGYFPQDCGAAVQNILLEAVSLGLGACWCGVYPKDERIVPVRELFKIPEPKIPFCVIAVGAPDEAPERRGFFEQAKVTYIE